MAAAPDGAPAAWSEAEARFDRWRRTLGLPLGPLACVALLLIPSGLPTEAAHLAAVLAWVVIWWITEAVPLAVTALLGPALAVVLGVGTPREMLAPFGDPVIFLFLGSFILAEAMSHHGLDRRIALALLARAGLAGSPVRALVAFTLLAGGLSMWLSNTATTAMLYPIALGSLSALGGDRSGLARPLLLACAYASSIGGVVTPVGTPPNLIALGQLERLLGSRPSFFEWMVIAAGPVLAMLVVMVVVVGLRMRGAPAKPADRSALDRERRELGPIRPGERNVLIAFSLAVVLWIGPGVLAVVLPEGTPWVKATSAALPESIVALLAAGLLFVLPVDWRARRFTIGWEHAARIDWGTLLLFGGGLSLGSAMFRTGLAAALGEGLTRLAGAESTVALTFLFAVFAIYFTEITSNTATATMLVPLAVAAAQATGADPFPPAIACAIGCSMAFMLPVATPPNAIVYGSGRVPITSMVRAGFALNAAAAVLVPALVLLGWRMAGH